MSPEMAPEESTKQTYLQLVPPFFDFPQFATLETQSLFPFSGHFSKNVFGG